MGREGVRVRLGAGEALGGSGPAVCGKCFNLALPPAGSDTIQVACMGFQPPVSGGFASERFGLLRFRGNCSTAKEKVVQGAGRRHTLLVSRMSPNIRPAAVQTGLQPGAQLQACLETYEDPRACA